MEDTMTITPLGSGQEVGRSCHLLEFRDMTILLDCGIHPGYEGIAGLPFFDRVEPERVDVLLISHFHLDHAASLPYFTERTGFKGRIFMTHPTKAVIRLLLGDYLRLMNIKNNSNDEDVLYTENELKSCIEKIELIDYHQTVSVKSLKFHALNAGHVLGAAMFYLEMGGRTVLYTGDYSMEDDRHLMSAEIPSYLKNVDVLMVESTYGVQVHASRTEREARFTGTVERVVTRGGRCLIPVFALGRAQELLLILDEYWQANPNLQHVPIWYASKLASRALRVYQTYANMMNVRIRQQMDISNPFSFNYIKNLKSIDVNNFDDRGASVVFASPGMLQSGVSRQLFDRWCTDAKNGVLIAGYAVEHTLAREIMNQPNEVLSLEGRRQPLNCLVEYVSFSAHVDFMQNRNFISQVAPKNIILVHGQKEEMGRLKSALMLQYKQVEEKKRPTITMPPNTQPVKLKFVRRRSAKVMGTLALDKKETVKGVLVTQNFSSKIVSPEDLATYTPLRVGFVSSSLQVPFLLSDLETIEFLLLQMFQGVVLTTEDIISTFSLHEGAVRIIIGKIENIAIVEWDADPMTDLLADAVVALLMHSQSSVAAVKLLSKPCQHATKNQEAPPLKKMKTTKEEKISSRIQILNDLLHQQFEDVTQNVEDEFSFYEFVIQVEEESIIAKIHFLPDDKNNDNEVTARITVISSEDENSKLANNVKDCMKNALAAAAPIPIY